MCHWSLKLKEDTPLANLWLTLLDKRGVQVERFGDSSSKIELLSDI